MGKQSADDQTQLSIAIVTPSFNQGRFLEQTIRSVLDQNYPRLEYFIADGSSTDGSAALIQTFENRLAGWVSEPDEGQYQAINKGFARTRAEIMAWLNADDRYLPWTLSLVAEVMTAHPEIEWLTSRLLLYANENGQVIQGEEHPGFSREQVLRGGTLPGGGGPAWAFVQQEATFWRRSLWEKTGGTLNYRQYPLAADFDLWMRFAKHAELYCLGIPLAIFRRHSSQKTSTQMQEYLRQAEQAFQAGGGRRTGWVKTAWLRNSIKLLRFFQRAHARGARQQGLNNHVVYRAESGTWELRDR